MNIRLLIPIILLTLPLWGQELPPVINYTPELYNADNQNWMLSQDNNGRIYVANNKGLLEYNGSSWQVYPTHNESIMRSVNVIGQRIYTGCYMSFGYWERDMLGMLKYIPLSEELGIEMIEDEQFWNIMEYQDWVIFQSLNRLVIVHSRSNQIHTIDPEPGIVKSFMVQGDIYYQVQGEGIYRVSEGRGELITQDAVAQNGRIVGMVAVNNQMLVFSENQGVFELQNDGLIPYVIPANDLIQGSALYSVIKLRNNDLVLGTIGQGILMISAEGKLLYNIDKSNTLFNNTVLNLYEDQDLNIWMGLDNGVACMNMNSPVRSYVDITGDIGTTYDSAVHNGMLYLGTNHGLYVKPLEAIGNFKLVPGTEGQVWTLNLIDDRLYCGHNRGTFLVQGMIAELISEVQGTWDIQKVGEDLLLSGKYSGLYLMELLGDGTFEEHKLDGFDISSRQFGFSHPDTLLVNHEYKGVYKLALDLDANRVQSYDVVANVVKSSHSGLIRYDDQVFYANKNGVYTYDSTKGRFMLHEQLSSLFQNDEYTSGEMVHDGDGHLWIFSKSYLCRVQPQALGGDYRIDRLPIPFNNREELVGFENMKTYVEDQYLFGNSSGYLVIDPQSIENENNPPKIQIDQVMSTSFNNKSVPLALEDQPEMEALNNNLEFHFFMPVYQKFKIPSYQYQLEGLYDEWSSWSTEPSIAFSNLSPGDYTFKVRGRINNTPSDNIAVYSFVILKPWYATNKAVILYVFLGFLLILFINWMYKRYYRNQQNRMLEQTTKDLRLQELANKQQITQLQNESLQQEIDSRTRELTLSAMNTVNKNSLLGQIKAELSQLSDPKDVKKLVKLIDDNITNKEDWQSFEKAFNHADKDFFKKVKEQHPEFTSGDLRLCMYLRLNLSSKEIAPLLNISVRSVEIKRYRLRKKANIPREIDLNQYFMQL